MAKRDNTTVIVNVEVDWFGVAVAFVVFLGPLHNSFRLRCLQSRLKSNAFVANYAGDISDLAFQTTNVTSAFLRSNVARLKFVNAGANPS